VDQVAESIRAVSEDARQVKILVDDVHRSSQEQARGIEQIGQAMAQMEQVTQKNAANAEETAAASERLTAQSQSLNEVATRLGMLVGAGAGGTVSATRHSYFRAQK